MATVQLQRCLVGVFALCVLVHSSSSWELNQVGTAKLVRKVLGSRSRRVEVTLSPIVRQHASRAAIVAEDVANSAARLAFLGGRRNGMPSDDNAPVSTVPGGYSMRIQLGTPPQTFTAIADTGSDLIWVQCKPCGDCFSQPDPLFDTSTSSTYKTVSCSNQFCQGLGKQETCSSSGVCLYQYGYGDQSTTSGPLSSDTMTLSGKAIPKLTFGCGTENQGTFQSVDGLVGLGLGPLSLPSQLSSGLGGKKFLYCLPANTGAVAASSGSSFAAASGGSIVFGESASPASGAAFTPLVANSHNPTFYYVTLKDISVDGKKLNIPSSAFAISPSDGSGGVVFDSGTTITQLAAAGYAPLKKALQAAIKYPAADGSQVGLDLCYDVSGQQQPSFPAVTFNFDGADFVLPTPNTFVAVDDHGSTVCLAMASSDFGLSIFGNTQQQSFQVVYDVDNSKLGWAPSQC